MGIDNSVQFKLSLTGRKRVYKMYSTNSWQLDLWRTRRLNDRQYHTLHWLVEG